MVFVVSILDQGASRTARHTGSTINNFQLHHSMRLTSLLPEEEPNCLVLKLRQMLIMLDCGLGKEQLYSLPVREGGLVHDQKDSTRGTRSKHALDEHDADSIDPSASSGDIRDTWATFLKTSSISRLATKNKRQKTSATTASSSSTTTNRAPTGQEAFDAVTHSSQEYQFQLPDFSAVDLKSIDVVLISNYNHILALPYLTEYTDFQGRIFATEPTIEFGRQFMQEFVEFFGSTVSSSPHHSQDKTELRKRAGAGLYPAYTMSDIKACIDKIQAVRFREHLALYGSLKLTAHSAGYCLGSSNWLIQVGTENIAFLSSTSTQTNLHPEVFDGTLLENAKTVITTDICPAAHLTYNNGINDILAHVAKTIAGKGHVVIPCSISGIIFDLVEDIYIHLNKMGLSLNAHFCFVSPVADTALQYSNILAEWMAPKKQEMVYLPEAPLMHAGLLQNNRAKCYSSVHGAFSTDLKTPCVVFGGHATLRSGPLVSLMHMWGDNPANTIVFVDPKIDAQTALEPFKSLKMAKCVYPLDVRLSLNQLVDILHRYKRPKQVLVAQSVVTGTAVREGATAVDNLDRLTTPSTKWASYRYGESVQLGIDSLYETVLLSEELARGIFPQMIGTTSMAPVAGSLSIYNNQMLLEPASATGRQILALYSQRHLRGVMNMGTLLSGLEKTGIHDPYITESMSDDGEAQIKVEFELEGKSGQIIVREKETIVKCHEDVRPLLREPILRCFQSI